MKTEKIRRSLCLLLSALVLCLGLYACGTGREVRAEKDELCFLLTNRTEDTFVLAVTWQLAGEPVGTTAVEVADGAALGKGPFAFRLKQTDLPADADLSQLSVKVAVTRSGEDAVTIGGPALSGAWGESYEYELKQQDGCYSLWEQAS